MDAGIAIIISVVALLTSLLSVGIVGGTLQRERKRRRYLESLQEPKPICGCKHHASFHDDEGCHHIGTDHYGNRDKNECGCKRYIGPQPLELMS